MGRAKRMSKHERCFQKALAAVDKGVDRRLASLIARMPLSTFQYRLMHKDRKQISRTYLTADEENVIVDLVNRYSARGFLLTSFSPPNELISPVDIEEILEDKREKRRKNIGLQPVVLRNGFLDTTFGLCLTSEEALKKAKAKDAVDKARKAELARKEADKAEREAIACERLRRERLRFERKAMNFRVVVYGVEGKLLRPTLERRMVAKRRTAERNNCRCVKAVNQLMG